METNIQSHQMLLSRLQHIDTLKLVLLALFTLGIYIAFYIKRQGAVINEVAQNSDQQLSSWFSLAPLLLAFASLFTQLIYFSDATEAARHLNEAVGLMFNLSLAVWGFAARGILQHITSTQQGSALLFDGLLTLLLSPFYFNYRINEAYRKKEGSAGLKKRGRKDGFNG